MRLWHYLAGLLLLPLPSPLLAQTPIPLPGTRPEVVETSLGASMVASGAYLAALDTGDDAVYVFRRDAGAWRVDARLDVPPGSLVGMNVGGVALSGTRLVVGAPGADERRGAAFVFERGPMGWTQTARLEPSERTLEAEFGASVAVSGDRIAIGQATRYINRGENEAAFVFALDPTGAWQQEARLISGIPTSTVNSQIDGVLFGLGVALSGDELAVAAPYVTSALNPRGRVYRFRRTASGWTADAPIETPAGGPVLGGAVFAGSDLVVGTSRGWHVYRDGTLATVLADTLASEGSTYARALSAGDGAVAALGYSARGIHLVRLEKADGVWALRPESGFRPRQFLSTGTQVAVTESHTVFGDWAEAHVIARAADGSRADTLRAPGLSRPFATGTQAGTALDVQGGRLVVGMPGADPAAPALYENRRGAAVLREPSGDTRLIQSAANVRRGGRSVSLGRDLVAVGGHQNYDIHAEGSPTFGVTVPSTQDVFSLDAAGETVAAGVIATTTQVGEVHIVTCPAGAACTRTATLTHVPTSGARGERFGQSVALDASGTTLAVGAPIFSGGGTNQVRVTLYNRDASGDWQRDAQLVGPSASSSDPWALNFGRALARSRDTVVVLGYDQLYVYTRTATGWLVDSPISISQISISGPTQNSRLALGGGRIAIGVPSSSQTPGQVLVYRPSGAPRTWTLDRTIDGGLRGGPTFGTAVAIDGTRLVIGAPGAAGGAGEVYDVDLGASVAAEDEATMASLRLHTPNPIRGEATVNYQIDAPATVRLTIYDMLGRRVATVVEGGRASGAYETPFPAGIVPGVYVVRLDADGRHVTRTVVVLP